MLKVVKRIRGQDLAQNIGEEVILLGKVGMVSKILFLFSL